MSQTNQVKQQDTVSLKTWIGIAGAMLGAFMAVLDIQITNSSLQDIQAALGATLEEGSWISTAYLIAEIVVVPLTGWLSQVFSVRRYLLVNVALFIGFSFACAQATSLGMMIVFRACQGFTGGGFNSHGTDYCIDFITPVKTAHWYGSVCHDCYLCPFHWTDYRRLADG